MTDGVARVQKQVAAFEASEGRRPRILVAKIGQDGHDRGQKVIASAFADLGFDVDIGPLFATPAEAARQAIENDVHILGVSSLAAAHLTLVPELKAELEKQGRGDIMIVVGGVVPPQDYDALTKAGAEAIFPPGTVIADAAEKLLHDAEQAARARERSGGVARAGSGRKPCLNSTRVAWNVFTVMGYSTSLGSGSGISSPVAPLKSRSFTMRSITNTDGRRW